MNLYLHTQKQTILIKLQLKNPQQIIIWSLLIPTTEKKLEIDDDWICGVCKDSYNNYETKKKW